MTGELPPAEAKMLETVLAASHRDASHGDASDYPGTRP